MLQLSVRTRRDATKIALIMSARMCDINSWTALKVEQITRVGYTCADQFHDFFVIILMSPLPTAPYELLWSLFLIIQLLIARSLIQRNIFDPGGVN